MKSHDVENYLSTHRRSSLIVLAVMLVTAVSGFFMGMRQTRNFSDETRDLRDRQRDTAPAEFAEGEIPQAVSYAELATANLQPNFAWTNSLVNLPKAVETHVPVPALTPNERQEVLLDREARRAYDGAPPVVPHPITQRSASACMTCHGNTSAQPMIAGNVPPRMSHANHASCTQCHVPSKGFSQSSHREFGLVKSNAFAGRRSPGPGSRAYDGAPPTIPHHTLMRENCYSCHGPGRVNAITTSHPDRQSCTQCHAPSASKDQRLVDLLGVRKPVQFPIDLTPQPSAPSVPAPLIDSPSAIPQP